VNKIQCVWIMMCT